jgi:hypothetical protein
MSRAGVIAVTLLCMPGPAGAAEQDLVGAKGTFRSGDVQFVVSDAYAFRTKESFGSGQVITVAVSNVGILEGNVDRWVDRKQVLEKRFKDDNTAVIYFEFSPEGAYRGMSYYLGPKNGCGYCSGATKSGVKLVNGRLVGPFSYQKDDVSWDIQLDVPVSPDDLGTPLPPGGGDPGKVYAAFAAAVKDRDPEGLKKTLVAQRAEHVAGAEKSGRTNDYLDFVSGGRYVDTVRVVKGFVKPTHAILAVAGEGPVGKRAGQVLLLKEAAGWRVQDEILDMVTE